MTPKKTKKSITAEFPDGADDVLIARTFAAYREVLSLSFSDEVTITVEGVPIHVLDEELPDMPWS